MRALARLFLGVTLKPFLQGYYLKSQRKFKYSRLNLVIHEGVFHPGLFFSSKFFAEFIETLELEGMDVLEVGCGSGLLSLIAASLGANVTSIDINEHAVANTLLNATSNNLKLNVIQSDLFDRLEGSFDCVLVNPPYFPKNPSSPAGFAWYCGENHSYFHKFFRELGKFVRHRSLIYMILSDQCDIDLISSIALNNGFSLNKTLERDFFVEKNFIFKIALL